MPLLPNPVYGFPMSGEMTPVNEAVRDWRAGPQYNVHAALGGMGYGGAMMNDYAMPVDTNTGSAGGYEGPGAGYSALGQPAAVWIGAIALLGVLAYFSTRPNTLGGANPAHIRIGGYNFMAVGLISAVFFILLKAIFNRFPVPGFTEFANAL